MKKVSFFRSAKTLSLVAGILFSALSVSAQSVKTGEVPKVILDNFKGQFPKAKSVSWEKDGDRYVVSHKEDQSVAKSTYSADGKYVKTAISMDQEDLPMNVFNHIKKQYPSYESLTYVYLIKEPKDLQYYLVGVSVPSKQLQADMRFTLIGSLISKTEQPMPEAQTAENANTPEKSGEKAPAVKDKKAGQPKADAKAESKADAKADAKANAKAESKNAAKAETPKKSRKTDPFLISEDKVPANVLKMFKKRMMNASDVRWYYKPGDSIYTVKCVVRDQQTLGKFSDKGKWISSRTELEKERVPSAVYKTINQFYPSYKFVSAGKEIRSDKQDFFAVEIIEKANARTGGVTTLYLDKSARIKYIEEPDYQIADPSTKLTAEEERMEKKLEKEFTKDRKLDIYPVKSISADEIPNEIHKWTDLYYPEYVYKNIRYEEDEDFEKEGNIYIILIQRPGVGQPYATVYFTRTGKFLKLVDEFRSEEEIEAQMEAKRTPPVVPMNVAAAFKNRVTDANDVSWNKDEENHWVASYTDKKEQRKQTAYTTDAFWVFTRTEIPLSKVPSSVRNYIEKNFAHTEIKECWSVSDPQNKLYYTVNLYNKKTKLRFNMSFTQSGKPME
ncbi:MAG: PepSY-like domain-containing protein [Bacteroidales bacterium]|nr:PepSY-like domain-containing protein [Bacteroidales bacterium]